MLIDLIVMYQALCQEGGGVVGVGRRYSRSDLVPTPGMILKGERR